MSEIGVVGFSFGLRKRIVPSKKRNPRVHAAFEHRAQADPSFVYDEPGPCNQRLGAEVIRLSAERKAKAVAVQWEIERYLRELTGSKKQVANVVVGLKADGDYLGSEDIWNAAKAEFMQRGITHVILVAQPGLHRWSVTRMARRDKFTVVKAKVNSIGFDSSDANSQWWTKGPILLFGWSVLRLLHVIKPGHRGRQ